MFQKAVKIESKLRLAISGPSGAGKTYTALTLATHLTDNKPIALVDTEHGSASKYADLFSFDVLNLDPPYHPDRYLEAIKEAAKAGYGVIILDSLSHAWNGTGGLLEIVDDIAKRNRNPNTFAAWKDATPIQNRFIDGLISANIHVIATMRSKQEYILQEADNGKKVPKKVGMAPVQRDGFEYEFDVFMEMDVDNTGIVTKSRCSALNGAVIRKPGKATAETLKVWLSGAPAPEKPALMPREESPIPAPTPEAKVKTNGNGTNGHTSPTGNGEKPPRYTPEALRDALTKSAELHRANNIQIKDTDRNMLAVNLENCFAGEADSEHKRHVVINYFFGVDSVKDLDAAQVTAVKRWLAVAKDEGGEWRPAADAVKEAKAVYRAALIAEGQQELIPA